MTLENEIKIHKEITDNIHNLFKSKREDYGSTTEELLNRYGPAAMLTFLRTKLERVDNLVMRVDRTPNHESINDTLLDLANYCIIWILERKKAETKGNVKITFGDTRYP